jgi:cation diffusion facilitator family transporter
MADQPYQRGLRISLAGLFVNAGLGVVKLLAGLLGHSTALVADAIESLTDLVSSLVVWSGLQIGRMPPDHDHPYGHGRAESLAALIVTVMLFGAGVGIVVEAISGIRNPHQTPAPFTLWVLVIVICIKEVMFRLARRTARASGSSLVLADAWHHRSDALTSMVAAGGISIALLGGERYAAADDWAALFAAGVIFFNAGRILRTPVCELMDKEPAEIVGQVRSVAERVPGVAGVEKVFARKSGLHYWVDMHVEVDAEMSVRQAHDVSHDVKDAIRSAAPNVQNVLVHIEPYDRQRRSGSDSVE